MYEWYIYVLLSAYTKFYVIAFVASDITAEDEHYKAMLWINAFCHSFTFTVCTLYTDLGLWVH